MASHICTCGDCNPTEFWDECKYEKELGEIYWVLHLMKEPDGHTAREHIEHMMNRLGMEPPDGFKFIK